MSMQAMSSPMKISMIEKQLCFKTMGNKFLMEEIATVWRDIILNKVHIRTYLKRTMKKIHRNQEDN